MDAIICSNRHYRDRPHSGNWKVGVRPRIPVPSRTWSLWGKISWILMSLWDDLDDDSKTNGQMRLQSFLGLYIFALLYELALSYDALRRRNTIQLVGLCICNQGLFAFGILQMREINDTIATLADKSLSDHLQELYKIELILVPVFLGTGTLCMSFFTWKLRAEFSWSIYKNISADLQMKRRYFVYQVCCDNAGNVLCSTTDPIHFRCISLSWSSISSSYSEVNSKSSLSSFKPKTWILFSMPLWSQSR